MSKTEDQTQTTAEKQITPVHYWMASAEVYHCAAGKQDEGVIPATLNVVFTTAEHKITSKELINAQRGAQHQLVQRAGAVKIDIIDVVFNSFSHLGFMSPAEFLGATEEALAAGMAEGAAAAKQTVQ